MAETELETKAISSSNFISCFRSEHLNLEMKSKESDINSQRSCLPFDIALKIASSLEVLDICALGSCSQFWREICGSDSIWKSLIRNRWPSLLNDSSSNSLGWREIYKGTHKLMAEKATSLVEFVEHCSPSESLEFKDYTKAIEDLSSMQLSFKDIQMFLFKPNLNVLINLVGLHYCIFCLKVPVKQVMDTLVCCKISDRELCVKWWKLGRWFYGFRIRDLSNSRTVSLADLLTAKGDEVLRVLQRGAVYEVLRIEIAIPSAASTSSWSIQSTYRQH